MMDETTEDDRFVTFQQEFDVVSENFRDNLHFLLEKNML